MGEGDRKREIESLMKEFTWLKMEDIKYQKAKFELEEKMAEDERYRRRQIVRMIFVFLLIVASIIISIMRY